MMDRMPTPLRTSNQHRSWWRSRGPLLRLRVWRNAVELDLELAAGADPSSSPELALRAQQLLRWRFRTRLAQRVAQMARGLPDRELSEEMYGLAARVSRVNDRDVVPVATASCLVQRDRFRSMPAGHAPRPDEARLVLRGGSPL